MDFKLQRYFLFPLLVLLAITLLTSCSPPVYDDQSGFVSIDCGLPENSTYSGSMFPVTYTSDEMFINTGVNARLLPKFISNDTEIYLETVRSFPQGKRNCYNLRSSKDKDSKFLVRAFFMYGNYDNKSHVPKFDLHIGTELWDTIQLDNSSHVVTKEIIHVFSTNYTNVCLVNTGKGTPFISALELRRFRNSMYPSEYEISLELKMRYNFVYGTMPLRYSFDAYDRIWEALQLPEWDSVSTRREVDRDIENDFYPPTLAMGTAATPLNSTTWTLSWGPADLNIDYHTYLYFAEIVSLLPNQTRKFDVIINSETASWEEFEPEYLTTLVMSDKRKASNFNYTLRQTNNSTLPPLINALEVYAAKRFFKVHTDENDVDAIMDIKRTYDVKKNWQGDPCLPKDYTWEGLRCNYSSSNSTRIIGLDLSSSGLSGDIPSSLSNLTALQYLDLSDNDLTGPIPSSLAGFAFLRFLNLTGNKFWGSIPLGLAEKANNETLLLGMDGFVPLIKNQCQSAQCTKKKLSIPVVASVAVLLMLLIVAITIYYFTKRKGDKRVDSFDSRSQRFSYTKIVSMTNNFEKILGRGGFGLVYHGYLDNKEVAVKMLAETGYKEFQIEAELLGRVHHRNLISLVGYCYEGAYMALVYEYMANGTVKEHLNGPKSLTWIERLQVALNGAEGLDYLQNGCTPPIVHRDVKSTNILLDANFHAKLADFGISRAFSVDESSFVSTAVVGTIGYLDPEYAHLQKLHEKSDVYSFGVVLLELITGQPPVITSKNCHITQWVGNSLTTGDVADVIDPSLDGTYDSELVEKYVRLAISCCSPSSANRPTMHYVSSRLEEYLEAATEATKGIMVYFEDSTTIPYDSEFSNKF
ncbi:LOW QUALITY PROTEIN: putative leucine-rich repeat receptor-like protein kinase At2g19210 [Solanum pennellii]|uniref:non-specific serine/threonine protein kinase n=1 Tax=Solanum pennellii TaxID=28526 RepID=A0ABM1GAZ5_SOLPN|nr:LOW QUALITY PROTEIN: putative leucine-rich repeat receptor-like protein kinase At2g19210 [Solanum pennellii]